MNAKTIIILSSTPAGRKVLLLLAATKAGYSLIRAKMERDRIASAAPFQKLLPRIARGDFTARRRP